MTDAEHRLAMLRGLPGLSAAELEALALLSEECAEVGAIIGKALRHGLDSTHPDGGATNREAISREAGQVIAAIYIAADIGVINLADLDAGIREKWHKVGQYLHHIEVKPVERTARRKP